MDQVRNERSGRFVLRSGALNTSFLGWLSITGALLVCAVTACGGNHDTATVGGAGASGEITHGVGSATGGGYGVTPCNKHGVDGGAEGGMSGAGGSADPSTVASAAGDWTYSFFSPDLPKPQTGKVTLTQDGSMLTGDDGTGAVVTGKVDGRTVTLTSTWDQGSNTFIGTLSEDGQTMSGTWNGTYGSGTFIATKN